MLVVTPASTPKVLNRAHPLIANSTWSFLGDLAAGDSNTYPSGTAQPHGTLTGGPTWRRTQWGRGVETDLNKYVNLTANIRPGAPFTILVAYTYRYDASSSGGNTESGILFSTGTNGISLRHGTSLEFLKSRVTSYLSFAATPTRGTIHTAAATCGYGPTSTIQLYYDGNQVGIGSTAVAFTGTTTTGLGHDAGATIEYGRHTILACFVYDSRTGKPVLPWSDIRQFHNLALQGFQPLWIKPLPQLGDVGSTTWFPTTIRPTSQVEEVPFYQPPRYAPALWPSSSAPSVTDWIPSRRENRTYAEEQPYYKGFIDHRVLPGQLLPGPPSGPGRGKARPLVPRVPRSFKDSRDWERRLAFHTEIVSSIFNALLGQGVIQQEGADDWLLRSGGFAEARNPGTNDDRSKGVTVGASWVNTLTQRVWFCVDNTQDNAVWRGPF